MLANGCWLAAWLQSARCRRSNSNHNNGSNKNASEIIFSILFFLFFLFFQTVSLSQLIGTLSSYLIPTFIVCWRAPLFFLFSLVHQSFSFGVHHFDLFKDERQKRKTGIFQQKKKSQKQREIQTTEELAELKKRQSLTAVFFFISECGRTPRYCRAKESAYGGESELIAAARAFRYAYRLFILQVASHSLLGTFLDDAGRL